MSKRDVTILVPGRLNDTALEAIDRGFRLVRIERPDPALVTPQIASEVRGMAMMGSLTAQMIDALPNLEIVASFGVGYDGIDASHAAASGVVVTNTPDVLSDEVADTAIALLINTVRNFGRAEAWLRAGRWARDGAFPLSSLTLSGRKVGIFGMGRIGLAIAKRLEGFGVEISYHNRREAPGVSYRYFPTLRDLAEHVDTLICVVPGGEATRKAVNAEIFAALGSNGVFVNVGRGTSVDEDALIAALQDRTIAAAGLDVFEDEPHVPEALLALDNASLLPHVASASVHTRSAMGKLVAANLVSWFDEGRALTPVVETQDVQRRG